MLDFKDVQSTARTTIAAGAYFAGQSVIANDGTKRAQIQAALGPALEGETQAPGFVVVVWPPYSISAGQQTKGVALASVKFNVWVAVNPAVNAADGGAGKDLLEAVQNVVALLLEYEDDIKDHFELSAEDIQLMATDEGWIGYELEFEKQVALS